jgi:hypothetical protein
LLHPSVHETYTTTKVLLVDFLQKYYLVPTRQQLTANSTECELAMTALFDTLVAWITLAQATENWSQAGFIALIEPTILRLCGNRRASPFKDEKRRRDAIHSVYTAAIKITATKDPLTELMTKPLGISGEGN